MWPLLFSPITSLWSVTSIRFVIPTEIIAKIWNSNEINLLTSSLIKYIEDVSPNLRKLKIIKSMAERKVIKD